MAFFRSFAKINLSLAVGRRRADGYHELRTVFQTIDLADDLEIERRFEPGVKLEVRGATLPTDERNLAVRAAQAFLAERAPAGSGAAIRLTKRIPVAAGLGGGSSNAATVLMGLHRVFERTEEASWLDAAARRLGADVPFFLVGGTALGEGRGDLVSPLVDAPRPSGELVLLLPHGGLATAEVYAALAALRESAGELGENPHLRLPGDRSTFDDWIGRNDLEEAAFRLSPDLGALYTSAVRSGARRVRMSGSGSTLFALFDTAGAVEAAARHWPPGIVWKSIGTLDRAAWRSAGGWDLAGGD